MSVLGAVLYSITFFCLMLVVLGILGYVVSWIIFWLTE